MAIVLASVGAYLAVRSELRGQVDDSLLAQGERAEFVQGAIDARADDETVGAIAPELPPGVPRPPLPTGDEAIAFVQIIGPDGRAVARADSGEQMLPVTGTDREIAETGSGHSLSDGEAGSEHVRILTVATAEGGAVQIGASLEGVDSVLADLRVVLVIICLAGVAVAALLARALAQRVIGPISELTETAEHISATDDLSRRIEVEGEDEVARLATRFNAMLDAIERSQAALTSSLIAQSQLVADASHELRTPIASLRTDVESLIAHPELDGGARERRLVEVEARVEELTALVNDVIELARGDAPAAQSEDVRLDELAASSIEWLHRHAPERRVETSFAPSVVEGRPDRIVRAINNLLDNAHKYSPAAEPIEVSVADHTVVVRDHGPGIPPERAEEIFSRFHRGDDARGVPGSGLGLAIVRQVAESHGGSVAVEDAEGGGAVFRLRLG